MDIAFNQHDQLLFKDHSFYSFSSSVHTVFKQLVAMVLYDHAEIDLS